MKFGDYLFENAKDAVTKIFESHKTYSDSMFAKEFLCAIFDWQPIETAPKGKFILGYSPLSEEAFVMS